MENSALKDKLLKLQELDFVLDDIKLYLDTHPDDTNMLMKYCTLSQRALMLRNEIEMRYRYPLTARAAAAFGPFFGWINSPWPWCKGDPRPIESKFMPCGNQPAIDTNYTCTCECEKETEVCN